MCDKVLHMWRLCKSFRGAPFESVPLFDPRPELKSSDCQCLQMAWGDLVCAVCAHEAFLCDARLPCLRRRAPQSEGVARWSLGPSRGAERERARGARFASTRFMLLDRSLELGCALGQGGMGRVWSAHHTLLGREVAVKVLADSLTYCQESRARLLREARMMARVDSPLVVRVLDCISPADAPPYIVLEKVEGEDLAARLDRLFALPLSEVLSVTRQVARALEAVHAAGIVHGDVKLENVIASEIGGRTRVKLIDFGVARASNEVALASDRLPAGTPPSMSPEQLSLPTEVDTIWDVWGLAVLTYNLLTGRTPFEGTTIKEVLFATTRGHFLPPSSLRSDLGACVDDLFMNAFAREKSRRYATVSAFSEALECALDSENEIAQTPISERTIIAVGHQASEIPTRAETTLPLLQRRMQHYLMQS
jgi:serine/threonine protein kinase